MAALDCLNMDETNPSHNYLKVKLEKADQQPSDLPGEMQT